MDRKISRKPHSSEFRERAVRQLVATLGCSWGPYVRAFRHERQSAWLDGIEGAFRHFGGVTAEVPVDNAKALVRVQFRMSFDTMRVAPRAA